MGNIAKENNIGIYLRLSSYNNVSGNILIGNDECIIEVDCEGNIFKNNDFIAGDKNLVISGYNLFFLLGILAVALIFIEKRLRKT